ncbi:16S rRNA (uracil(1498)-N(3))-methyltransferase [Mycobacterium koreense]|uniref:Ribosomal RNA small subunit methyltransferase E n=1 Tax=Mycolicibacillus koreensis TaxID=1069220 RepID=A0A7I7S8W4_9MYCO|nr:16S rRNA (uracil(1498)-N(3))-methyltransferase [Mycolicibacillus koreensis]MCV7249233.1 16S rRNA (uracil(1498)-N(3))-methyltransferase [Mycolicibacillus koreensis]ODR10255.1 16S rRNA (uracil(1498)-N(3))-methyltransferase [Mycolicibacillus koreensis]OSC35616.1 16S rRNA (uracil(1498)-N(3))-methyltransferase [Mycolicibacillus koreensis]BBY53143.1 ribosomal RNA small subunit methyltransferase E [Mycolicibacillus koreensis]
MLGLFYVDTLPEAGELAELTGEEGFHAATVRRTRRGEQLLLGDGAGELAHCVVEHTARGELRARVRDRWSVPPPAPPVTVVQALPKSERSELAVELATEAGADVIVPWAAARCVARWDASRADKGVRRWRAVARAAARQSRRAHIPAVAQLSTTAALVDRIAAQVEAGAVVLALHESADTALTAVGLQAATAVLVLVGPEGGLGDDELARLTAAGATAVRLGPTVLRTSTAAAVALGALGVLTPRWTG